MLYWLGEEGNKRNYHSNVDQSLSNLDKKPSGTTFSHFTEAAKTLFQKGVVVEIGPGFYVPPTLSILQNSNEDIEYIAIDGAWDYDDCFEKFYQVGEITNYRSEFLRQDKGNNYGHLHLIQAVAHFLPLRDRSVDGILCFKVLTKLHDAIIYIWKKLVNSLNKQHEKVLGDRLQKIDGKVTES